MPRRRSADTKATINWSAERRAAMRAWWEARHRRTLRRRGLVK